MSDADALSPLVMDYRLKTVEDRVSVLADRESVLSLRKVMEDRGRELQKQVNVKADKEDLTLLRGEVRDLAGEVRGLRKVMMATAASFATGSIAVSLTLIATSLH